MNIGKQVKSAMRAFVLVGFAGFAAVSGLHAQEVTPEHTAAAKAAMKATGASSRLDKILPELAELIKNGLITNRPDMESEISTIVNEVAISLAPRRGPLEDEVAAIYAKAFTMEELQTISTFFSSDAGNKFVKLTPLLFGEVDQSAKVWRNGITRDMRAEVHKKLKEADLQ